MYMTGKGNNHLVTIIFPPDTIEAIRVLCDTLVRAQVDVSENNRYVFPSIQNSEHHVSGWHAVHKMCKLVGPSLINLKTLTATSSAFTAISSATCNNGANKSYKAPGGDWW